MFSPCDLFRAALAYLAGGGLAGDALLHDALLLCGLRLCNFACAGLDFLLDPRGYDQVEVLCRAQHRPGVSLCAAPSMVRRPIDAAGRNAQAVQHRGAIVHGGGPMYASGMEDGLRVLDDRSRRSTARARRQNLPAQQRMVQAARAIPGDRRTAWEKMR